MKVVLVLFILLFSQVVNTQTYLEDIADKTCSCTKKELGLDRRDDNLKTRLGLCIIKSSKPYYEELNRDYGIDLNESDFDGETLGKLIGFQMIGYCPEVFNLINEDNISENNTVEGTVIKVNKKGYLYFIIKNEQGEKAKYYWLTYIDSEDDLINNYKSYSGQNVSVTYKIFEIFDPKMNAYRKVNVLTSLYREEK